MNAPAHRRTQTPVCSPWAVLVLLALIAAGGGFLAGKRWVAHLGSRPLPLPSAQGSKAPPAAEPANRWPAAAASSLLAPLPMDSEAATSAAESTAAARELRIQSVHFLAQLKTRRLVQMPPGASFGLNGGVQYVYGPDANGTLAPNFGEFYALNPDEVTTLQTAITQIKQQVDELVAANTTVHQTGPEAYTLTIQPAPAAVSLRDEFLTAFQTALGPERYEAFMAFNGDMVASATSGPKAFFASYGGIGRAITIRKAEGKYFFTDAFSDRRSGSAPNREVTAQSLDSIRGRLGAALTRLPPDF